MSNPLQNIDPRSLTQVVPLFTSAWIRNSGALPDLDGQSYGPQFSLAITDRFSVGLNQGGLAFVHIDRVDARRPLINRIIDLGTCEQTGNTVTLAVGANLALIPNRLEVGGAYIRALSTERNVEIDAMITKMVIRY